jgi:hypothetical protein
MVDRLGLARRAWSLLEPIHAVAYFSPEPRHALRAAGYRGFWMGYFAGRAAPLGTVGPEVVEATFYNFNHDRVARALPDAWDMATPERALEARGEGSREALHRLLGGLTDSAPIGHIADVALEVALAAPLEGRALFAANRALRVPSEPVARLWHAATLLREHRGDGHVAALVTAGVSGRESHVLHALSLGFPREVYAIARDFTQDEWTSCVRSLEEKGLVDGERLSKHGQELKAAIEATTDRLAASAFVALSDRAATDFLDELVPLVRAVVRGGEIPLQAPMGIDLRGLAGA